MLKRKENYGIEVAFLEKQLDFFSYKKKSSPDGDDFFL
jgi:hypothetical protein